MKEHFWDIKVADLLNNPGNTDEMKFQDKLLKNENYQTKISGNIFLQSLNHGEILLQIKINFEIEYICDICLKKYKSKFEVEEKNVKFTDPNEIEIADNADDEIFLIDTKNQIINIKELLEILVENQQPIIKNCGEHENNEGKDFGENDEEKTYYTFDFGKMLKS